MRRATAEWRATFVIYLSDHGDALGDHNLWRKGYPYEQVASVPFYVRWPQVWDDAGDFSCDSDGESGGDFVVQVDKTTDSSILQVQVDVDRTLQLPLCASPQA